MCIWVAQLDDMKKVDYLLLFKSDAMLLFLLDGVAQDGSWAML